MFSDRATLRLLRCFLDFVNTKSSAATNDYYSPSRAVPFNWSTLLSREDPVGRENKSDTFVSTTVVIRPREGSLKKNL